MSSKIAVHVGVGERMGDLDRSAGVTSIVVPGMFITPGSAGRGEPIEERPLVREDAHLVAVDHVQPEQVVVEEARWPGARHHGAGVDVLDVAHRPGELGCRPSRRTSARLSVSDIS